MGAEGRRFESCLPDHLNPSKPLKKNKCYPSWHLRLFAPLYVALCHILPMRLRTNYEPLPASASLRHKSARVN